MSDTVGTAGAKNLTREFSRSLPNIHSYARLRRFSRQHYKDVIARVVEFWSECTRIYARYAVNAEYPRLCSQYFTRDVMAGSTGDSHRGHI